MSENAIGYLINRAGYQLAHVPHGWRAAFSSVMNERYPEKKAVIDLMLAHVPKDKVESAYNRALHLDKRIILAHVLISGSRRIFSANFQGNTFTRLGAPPVKHSIFATGATHNVTINLNGNGFGELGGGFVPTSAQRYIQVDGGENIYTLVDIGNQYMTAAARPIYQSCRVITNNTMPYAMGYCTAAGTIEGAAFNVQSITKT